MKTNFLKVIAYFFAVAAIAVSFTACDKDKSGNQNPPVIPPIVTVPNNSLAINNEAVAEFKSIFFENYFNYKMVVASPVENMTSWNDIVDNHHPYIMFLISDSLTNKNFDIMSKVEAYSFISTMDELDSGFVFNNENISQVFSGYVNYTVDSRNNASFIAEFTTSNQEKVSVKILGLFKEPEATNIITNDGNEQLILKSYYDTKTEGMTYLYFTPQDIEKGEDYQDAKQYSMLQIDNSLLNKTIDITTETGVYMYVASDNFMDDMFYVTKDATNDATGTIKVTPKTEAGSYLVDVNLTSADGAVYSMHYEGTCEPFSSEPDNEIVVKGGNAKTIYSALVDQTNSVWVVYLSTESGIKTIADMKDSEYISYTMPGTMFDGDAHGFSTDSSLSIYYNGSTFGLGNSEHLGTLYGTVNDDDTILVKLKEWSTPIEAYYHGPATIIK